MNILSCGPNEGMCANKKEGNESRILIKLYRLGWLPFSDPVQTQSEQDEILSKLNERVLHYGSDQALTSFETSEWNLRWILHKCDNNIEEAWSKWMAWVKWRRGLFTLHHLRSSCRHS
jgi:hypothetical protein